MLKATLLTKGKKEIDIVDRTEDVISEYYILRKDIDGLVQYMERTGNKIVTNDIARKLILLGYLKVKS